MGKRRRLASQMLPRSRSGSWRIGYFVTISFALGSTWNGKPFVECLALTHSDPWCEAAKPNAWSRIYEQRREEVTLTKENIEEKSRVYGAYLRLVQKHAPSGALVVDCGSGPGRYANLLALLGFRVVAVDRSSENLKIAQESSFNLGLSRHQIEFVQADFFHIHTAVKPNSVMVITNQGTLEHYCVGCVRRALVEELRTAPLVVFSVPTQTDPNKTHFSDKDHRAAHRNLWPAKYWLEEVLAGFNVIEWEEVHQAYDELFCVIKREGE